MVATSLSPSCISIRGLLTMARHWHAAQKTLSFHMRPSKITGGLLFIVTYWLPLISPCSTLLLVDAPTVTLSFGLNLEPNNIAEGNDVYFECKINANPEVYKVVWLHNVTIFEFPASAISLKYLFAGRHGLGWSKQRHHHLGFEPRPSIGET